MSTYTARATRTEGWWAVTVDEVDGLFTQAKRLDKIPDLVRDALALFPELESAPATAEVLVRVGGDEESTASHARELNSRAKEAQARATAAMSEAAHSLAAAGLPYRDIGQLLGVSFQRAQKLATSRSPR
ncbi:transcriptional regulator [Gordonia sp. (in: high G+C Gram-positive bacteria)]|uniref:transcriptional regulator n=1 Tax=Gordonia sp. (in: high G+C Gram-positive bacteria) TaxID=84139 RepID=UPI003527AD7B